MPEAAETSSQGICVRCRRLLPWGSFRRNAAGAQTAWCEVCRQEAAKKWGVDEDLVELTYGLHVFEQTLKKEAEVVASANVNQGREAPAMLDHLRAEIRRHDQLRYHRIPDRLAQFLKTYRTAFFYGISMAEPKMVPPVEAAAR